VTIDLAPPDPPTPARGADRVLDRHGKLAALARGGGGVLELGCGPTRRHPEAVTVDALDFDAVDVVGDVFEVLARIPDASLDAVHSYHFLEHVSPLGGLVGELARVLRPGGLLHTVVPHFSNPYFYSDYTHRQAFGLYSFSYLADDPLFRRRVPRYQRDTGLVLEDVRLGFKAPPPFYVRYALRRVLGVIVNCSRLTQEWYEAGWAGWFPCYELDFKVRRR
jgi:SAM-dependent methyltransferase